MSGRIKLHRQIIEREWYQEPNVSRLFFHCLLSANHITKTRQGVLVKRGSFITSYGKLSTETKLSVKQVRLVLDKLQNTGEIDKQTTSKYTMITVVKYCDYNDIGNEKDKQRANKGQTKGKQRATTKEGEESKEGKESNIDGFSQTLLDFYSMRSRIKKPMTEKAKQLLLLDLEKFAPGDEKMKITILNKSIMNCWQGVFALKKEDIESSQEPMITEYTKQYWKCFEAGYGNDDYNLSLKSMLDKLKEKYGVEEAQRISKEIKKSIR